MACLNKMDVYIKVDKEGNKCVYNGIISKKFVQSKVDKKIKRSVYKGII